MTNRAAAGAAVTISPYWDANLSRAYGYFLDMLAAYLLEDRCLAMHLFFDEEAGMVRIFLWGDHDGQGDCWGEEEPVSGEIGLRLLRKIRRPAWSFGVGPFRRRRIRLQSGPNILDLRVQSPHCWEVRVDRGTAPPVRPYKLAPVWRADEDTTPGPAVEPLVNRRRAPRKRR